MGYKISAIDPSKTAVIVVDMENDFVKKDAPMEAEHARSAIPNMQKILDAARTLRMKVIYTTHVHREDGSDMGRFSDIYPPIAERAGLIDGTSGVEIYSELEPEPEDIVLKKHRYSAFFDTPLDTILRGNGIDTVIIIGTTTENCCHATARDAMFRDYYVAFISDATGTFDYPDTGYGAMSACEVHQATLAILSFSTADVLSTHELLDHCNTSAMSLASSTLN